MLKNRSFLNLLLLGLIVILIGVYFAFANQSNNSQLQQKTTSEQNQSIASTECRGTPTAEQTEGPYYKADSPEQNNIAEGLDGEKLIVTGYVFDKTCKPIANAWLDFWQADSNGDYDNEGYSLRGHQYTDENGKYYLETIVPAEYPGRTPHIHVKVRKDSGDILTTQMYFPQASGNTSDSIFDETLLMKITDEANEKAGEFSFVLKD
jgi:protocatechuate 3,4-dioxygenase beta subunit